MITLPTTVFIMMMFLYLLLISYCIFFAYRWKREIEINEESSVNYYIASKEKDDENNIYQEYSEMMRKNNGV